MKVTPDVFEAALKCPTKCWLRASGESSAGNTYAEWVTDFITRRIPAYTGDRVPPGDACSLSGHLGI
jgi:hypothetical protein